MKGRTKLDRVMDYAVSGDLAPPLDSSHRTKIEFAEKVVPVIRACLSKFIPATDRAWFRMYRRPNRVARLIRKGNTLLRRLADQDREIAAKYQMWRDRIWN